MIVVLHTALNPSVAVEVQLVRLAQLVRLSFSS